VGWNPVVLGVAMMMVMVLPVVDQGAMHTLLALVLAALVQLVVDRG